MSLSRFDYYAPEGIEDACRLLMELGGGAVVMAGGTDILLKIRRGLLKAKAVVDLQKIKGMNITITTSAKNDKEAFALLTQMGFPIKKQ